MSVYPSLSQPTIPVSLNLYLFLLCICCQVLWLMSSKSCSIVYGLTLFCGHGASNKNINADWPTFHTFPQNASAVHLAVSQTICGAAVMCRPAHWPPVLPFVPSANNCRSEHIHRMLLSDVAVTTEQHQGKYIGLILGMSFILNDYHLSCYWI